MSAASPLIDPPVGSIAAAIQRMEAIQADLQADDGLSYFNLMYLEVTKQFQERIEAGFFQDQPFMERLDVVFANMYFDATRSESLDPSTTPRAWTALFERRADQRVLPLQFAIAGMNAHINFDLPRSLVATCQQLHTRPSAGSHYRDFNKVNEILAEVEPAIRDQLEQEHPLDDRQLEHLENVLANWSIVRAREAAFEQSELLWWIRENAELTATYTATLDRIVGFAGRGLLLPLI
jgi:Family of unknown function (DUF5995)